MIKLFIGSWQCVCIKILLIFFLQGNISNENCTQCPAPGADSTGFTSLVTTARNDSECGMIPNFKTQHIL